jgi:hypothetical protein
VWVDARALTALRAQLGDNRFSALIDVHPGGDAGQIIDVTNQVIQSEREQAAGPG